VNDHEAAAAREEGVEVGAIGLGDVAGFLRVENEDVGLGELLRGGKRVRARGLGAAGVKERYPLGEEARVIVRARSVRLRAGAKEDANRRLRGEGDGSQGEKEKEEALHGEK
jgi:hypothetical protein